MGEPRPPVPGQRIFLQGAEPAPPAWEQACRQLARAQAAAALVSASDPALQVGVTVTAEGTVRTARVLSGPPEQRLAAEKTTSDWTFAPTAKGGTATVRIPFRLE